MSGGGDEVEAAVQGPGGTLKTARETFGVSRREVAQALNLPEETLEAIEENDLEAMPDLVFARGYVRSYAKLMELDPEPLIGALSEATGQVPIAEPRGLTEQQRSVTMALGALGAIVAVVVLVLVLVGGPDEAPAAVVEATEPPSDQPVDRLPPEQNLERTAEVPSAVIASVVEPEPLEPAQPEPTLAEPTDQPTPESSAVVVQRITPSGDDELVMAFTQNCWVEVRSVDDQRLYSRLGTASRPIHVVGEGPFRIQLGYAPGAEVRYNGEVMPLIPHTVDNVANLVVGQ